MGYAYHGQQRQLLSLMHIFVARLRERSPRLRRLGLPARAMVAALCLLFPSVHADGVREQTRLVHRSETSVTPGQATELTLTLTEVARRSIQTWVRTAGQVDETGRLVVALARTSDRQLVQPGQRVRVFAVASRSRMHQAKISRVMPQGRELRVEALLANQVPNDGSRYLMEIVVDRGVYLCVPNVSVIEEENRRVVYVQAAPGQFLAKEIHTGVQGESYTEVRDGLREGDLVVSIGSFFVDAERKLKSADTDEQ